MTRTASILRGLLADTWWFGLSQRLSEKDFKDLAELRAEQGFSAVQMVVGIPPEVGPENENAQSQVGFPWTLNGDFNHEYLGLAHDRIRFLNGLGFIVIVYGAWGHQVEWLGKEKMSDWWRHIIRTLDSLNVIYCLCGESSLWIGGAFKLLLDKSTDDLVTSGIVSILNPRVKRILAKTVKRLSRSLYKRRLDQRRDDWSFVLEKISKSTDKPIIVHPTVDEAGFEAVRNPELLAANTIQTGHDAGARNRLWQLPRSLLEDDPAGKGVINLEPWYEGIRDQFWIEDQMYAYWVTMLAGATAYCYGAHGVWNVGDGAFLAHWGKQTFAQAITFDTPRLLGLSHEQYLSRRHWKGKAFHKLEGEELRTIGRQAGKKLMQFFPDIARVKQVPTGKLWLPLEGKFADALPSQGQVLVFRD